MKFKDSASAIIGTSFFAVPYLFLATPIIPSLLIGAAAFTAGELVLSSKEKTTLKEQNRSLYDKIQKAKKENKHIIEMIPLIDDEEIQKCLNEINESVNKIIETLTKNPKKAKRIDNFFEYYLPVTIKIIDRYDEIENQNLTSKESKEFLNKTNNMVKEINKSFKKILSSLYKNDIVDTSADMKVLDSLLKADGLDDNEIVKEDD